MRFLKQWEIQPGKFKFVESSAFKNNYFVVVTIPVQRVSMMSIQRATGTSYVRETLVSNSILPQLILILPVESSSFLGDYDSSPYKSETVNLTELSLTCEGF